MKYALHYSIKKPSEVAQAVCLCLQLETGFWQGANFSNSGPYSDGIATAASAGGG